MDGDDSLHALVIASANPMLYCAGADIKAFTQMDEAGGRELLDTGHALMRAFGSTSTVTIAAVNALAFGGGCELAMACDVRIAAESATFGQPEINLGIIPGFGGTQRLPRLVGPAKALEMNLVGDAISADDAYEFGLANRVVPDHELFDTGIQWARKLGGQAPLAVEQVKKVSHKGDLDEGIAAEKAGLRDRLRLRGRARGHRRLPAEAQSQVAGQVALQTARIERLAELVREAGSAVALTGAGISVPSGIPDFRSPGTGIWEKVDPMEVAHIDAFRADPARFWSFYGQRFASLRDKRPNGAHEALVELERRGLLDGVITQNIDQLHRKAGTEALIEVHGTIAHVVVPGVRRARRSRRRARAVGCGPRGRSALRVRRAAQARRRAVRRDAPRGCAAARAAPDRRRRPAAVRRLLARGLPGGAAPLDRPADGRAAGDRHPGPHALRR